MSYSDNFDIDIRLNNLNEDDAELIPLLSNEEEDLMSQEKVPDVLPILSLRNTVLFPGVVIPITVGRDKSINLIKDANKGDKIIGVVSQKDDKVEDPVFDELNSIGTVAHVLKMLRMPDGNTTVIIQGKRRFKLIEQVQSEPYIKAKVTAISDAKPDKGDKEFEALVSTLKDTALNIIQISPNSPT